jgi:hypothetical protein
MIGFGDKSERTHLYVSYYYEIFGHTWDIESKLDMRSISIILLLER